MANNVHIYPVTSEGVYYLPIISRCVYGCLATPEDAHKCPATSEDINEYLSLFNIVHEDPKPPTTVPQVSDRSPSVHKDSQLPESAPLLISLHNQSILRSSLDSRKSSKY